MKFKSLLKKVFSFSIVFFAISFLIPASFAQSAARIRTFDAQHYIIRSSFDRVNKVYFGDVTVQVKPLKDGFTTLILDSVGMKFDSIVLEPEGKQLKFKQNKEQINIELGKTFSSNEIVSVRFKYSAQPKKGVYFIDEFKATEDLPGRSSQVWTQGEAEEVHHWFPSYDFPNDKATTEQYITIPADEIAVANGEVLETTANSDGTKTHHFKMPVPHSVYLTSFVVGKFTKVEAKYKNIPLRYYVYSGKEDLAQKAYGKTPDMMRVFEEVTKIDFPFNKYDQIGVAGFNFGGMENITATTMSDGEISFAATPFGQALVMDLVSHELAHSWFGNMVTTKDWTNLWLNEGFASFMEAVYREHLNGRKDYIRKISLEADGWVVQSKFGNENYPLHRLNPPTDDSLFGTTIYQKGGSVVHILREELGDEVFWKGVNIYLNRHKFANVETNDLKVAMEEASGKDLDWFFDQWVYKAGYPQLSVKQIYNPAKKSLTLTISQTQKTGNLTPSAFILPLDLEIKTAKGTQEEKIKLEKRIQTF